VDYARLIQQPKGGDDESDETSSGDEEDDNHSTDTPDDDSRSNNGDGSNKNNLSRQLRREHAALRGLWKSVLNKHHSNLALHSGMSVNSSKFRSRAVDVSFWEQVEGGVEHERSKQRRLTAPSSNDNRIAERGARTGADNNNNNNEPLSKFDDSKLYQQMLKDFISSSQSNGGSSSSGRNKSGMTMDPAHEAAERLKRAMRKKSGGGDGDADLTSLLMAERATADAIANPNGSMIEQGGANAIRKKAAATVDRRASKGRKIRYAVNPKLVNFTFPVSRPEPMIEEDVWFKSLFGGVGNKN